MKYTKQYLIDNKIAVECKTEEEANSVIAILNEKPCTSYNSSEKYLSVTSDEKGLCFITEGGIIFYKETVVPASEVIAYYEQSQKPKGKIIGYRAPFDIYRWEIKKGQFISANIADGIMFYQIGEWMMPKEIVETWEPVYEEEKPLLSSFGDIIKHYKGESDRLILLSIINGCLQVCFDEEEQGVYKGRFDFTPEFEKELKELGIKID